jgi:protease I
MRALTLSADQFEDTELTAPVSALRLGGVEVDVACPGGGTITGKQGTAIASDLDVTKVDSNDYALLLLPGGKAPAALRQDPTVLALARHWMDADKPVAAICHGPQILISAGRVQGREMTCYASVADELKAAGAQYHDEAVVTNGKLVTSREPKDLPMFITQMLRVLDVPSTVA